MSQIKLVLDPKDNQAGKTNRLPVGIHNSVLMTKLDFAPGEYLDIIFELDGAEAKARLWNPNGKTANQGETTEQAIAREELTNNMIIGKLAGMVLDHETLGKVEAASYDQLISKITRLMTPIVTSATEPVRFNIKLTANKDGYPTLRLPRLNTRKDGSGEQFIVLDTIERNVGISRLKYSQYEIDNNMTPKKAENTKKDDMPF